MSVRRITGSIFHEGSYTVDQGPWVKASAYDELDAYRIGQIEKLRARPAVTESDIKQMVNRFLGWRLPENFRPDAGISFKAEFNEHTPHPMKHNPTGTNLFDSQQTEAMVRYMVERMPE